VLNRYCVHDTDSKAVIQKYATKKYDVARGLNSEKVRSLFSHKDIFRAYLFKCLLTSATLRSSLFWDVIQRRPTFRDNLLVQSSRVNSQDGRDRLPRTVGNLLPIYAAQQPRREKNSFTPRWKPESRISYLHSVRLI